MFSYLTKTTISYKILTFSSTLFTCVLFHFVTLITVWITYFYVISRFKNLFFTRVSKKLNKYWKYCSCMMCFLNLPSQVCLMLGKYCQKIECNHTKTNQTAWRKEKHFHQIAMANVLDFWGLSKQKSFQLFPSCFFLL